MLDRDAERAALDYLLEATQAGRGGALTVVGDPGIGLTTLLDYAAGRAFELEVVKTSGIRAERHLAFAGLHRLCGPLLERTDVLPAPQRESLAAAFGMASADSPDPYLVGLGVLSLVSSAGKDRPLVWLVDDAHWLDEASADSVAFVARRLEGKRAAMVLALHGGTSEGGTFGGIAELRIGPLPVGASNELVASVVAGPLDPRVRDRLVAESGGLPLALVELPAQLDREQLAGLSPLPAILPVGERVSAKLLGPETAHLPEKTRTLLLLAATEPGAPPSLLWTTANLLGVTPEDAAPAETAGLLRSGRDLSFRHHVVGLAIYGSAPVAERRRVHQALVQAIGPDTDPDRHAFHRAAASLTPDEEVAAELELLAVQARGSGDCHAALELMETAAYLTPDFGQRYRRTLFAVQCAVSAGRLGRATALLDGVRPGITDDLQRSQAEKLRGEITTALGKGTDRVTTLLTAAQAIDNVDSHLARHTYLEAMEAAVYSGRLARETTLVIAAERARASRHAVRSEQDPSGLLLDGLVLLVTAGHKAAWPTLKRAAEAMQATDQPRWLNLGALVALQYWDDLTLHRLASRQAELWRSEAGWAMGADLGQLSELDNFVSGRLSGPVLAAPGSRPLAPAMTTAQPTSVVTPSGLLASAWRGSPAETRELAEPYMRQAFMNELGLHVALAQHALTVLEISLGRYEEALAIACQACEASPVYIANATLPELIEAAVRSGERQVALSASARLSDRASASGTNWSLGMLARSNALLAEGAGAEEYYRQAIEHLRLTRVAPHLARAHLLYGEWLRRERRRREAREQLRTARDMFIFMGAHSFAERALSELNVAGEHVGTSQSVMRTEQLTPQEIRVARLASDGASNAAIARELYLSPRTVEYHLHKIFRKLGVSSRTQLAKAVHDLASRGD